MSNSAKEGPVSTYEYLVLGNSRIKHGNESLYLGDGLRLPEIHHVERALNVLGAAGWQPVQLTFPYIFKRSKRPVGGERADGQGMVYDSDTAAMIPRREVIS